MVLRTVYGIQKLVSSMMSDVYVRAGHEPRLPDDVISELKNIVQPGDVLVVRKDFALTNYFLPGYWPHAALYLGHAGQLQQLGLHQHPDFASRWPQIDREPERPNVIESLKDGVRIRSWQSPLSSDSIVLLRPNLDLDMIGAGWHERSDTRESPTILTLTSPARTASCARKSSIVHMTGWQT